MRPAVRRCRTRRARRSCRSRRVTRTGWCTTGTSSSAHPRRSRSSTPASTRSPDRRSTSRDTDRTRRRSRRTVRGRAWGACRPSRPPWCTRCSRRCCSSSSASPQLYASANHPRSCPCWRRVRAAAACCSASPSRWRRSLPYSWSRSRSPASPRSRKARAWGRCSPSRRSAVSICSGGARSSSRHRPSSAHAMRRSPRSPRCGSVSRS